MRDARKAKDDEGPPPTGPGDRVREGGEIPSAPSPADLGRQGEEEAARYLLSLGWTILGRNLRTRGSEIDLACRAGEEMVFVEVRVRSLGKLQPPESTVGPRKMAHLIRGARTLAERWQWKGPWRIDLVAFTVDRKGVWRREHLEDITAGGWDPWGSCRG